MTTTISSVQVAATEAVLILPDGSITNSVIATTAAIETSKLEQRVLQAFPVKLTDLRVWDAMSTLLPSAAANDDLGLIVGTFGTDSPLVNANDLKAAGATTRRARLLLPVPQNYDDGATIQLRLRCATETTVSDGTCTVDVEVYKGDGTGAVGSDLCTTAAQSINSLTPANVDFTISASGVDPGDLLDVRVSVACNDTATATAVTPTIYSITLLCDTRG